jgi:hypothetical protein
VDRFAAFDEERVRKVYTLRDNEEALIASAKEYAAELERIFDDEASYGMESATRTSSA